MTQIGQHDDAYRSTPLEQKLAWFQNAPGLSAVEPARQFMSGAATLYTDSDAQVRATMRNLGIDWTGDAATNAGATLQRAAEWSREAGAVHGSGGRTVEGYGRSFEALRGQVHWDDPWAWGWNDTASAAASVATLSPAPLLGNLTADYFTTAQQNRTNDATAIAALRIHEDQTRTAVESFPSVPPAGVGPQPGLGVNPGRSNPIDSLPTPPAATAGGGAAPGDAGAAGGVAIGAGLPGPVIAGAGGPGAGGPGGSGSGAGGTGAGGVGPGGSGGLGGVGPPGTGGSAGIPGGAGGVIPGVIPGATGVGNGTTGVGNGATGRPGGVGGASPGGAGRADPGGVGRADPGGTGRADPSGAGRAGGARPGGAAGDTLGSDPRLRGGIDTPGGGIDTPGGEVGARDGGGLRLSPGTPLPGDGAGRFGVGGGAPGGTAGGWRDVVPRPSEPGLISRGPAAGPEFAGRLPSGPAVSGAAAEGAGMPFLGGMGVGAGAQSTEHRNTYWVRSAEPFDVPLPPHVDGVLHGGDA